MIFTHRKIFFPIDLLELKCKLQECFLTKKEDIRMAAFPEWLIFENISDEIMVFRK
jgi:hypothetical protein